MAESFDPYVQWLGIRDPLRPPNHYRLLGVEPFEADPDVLSNAADRQMAHLRTFQAGKHSAESQQLLNELARAKVCLLNSQKKAVYDKQLRTKLEAAERNDRPPPPPPPLPVAPPKVQDVSPIPIALAGGDPATAAAPKTPPQKPPAAGSPPLGTIPPPPPLPGGGPLADGSMPQTPPPPEMPPPRGPAPPIADEAAGERTKADNEAKPRRSSCSSTASFLVTMLLVLAGLIAFFTAEHWMKTEDDTAKDGQAATSEAAQGEPESLPDEQPEPDSAPEPAADPEPDPSSDPEPSPPTDPAPEPEPSPDPEPMPEPEPDTPDDPPAVPRRPVPAKNVQQAKLRKIRGDFRDRYETAKTPGAKRSLAATLLGDANKTHTDLDARYVLLTQARDLAIAGGDTSLMIRAITAVAKEYQVDLPVVAAEAYKEQAEDVRGKDKTASLSVVRKGLELVRDAADANDFDSALTLAESSRDLARAVRPRNEDLVKTAVREIQWVKAAGPLHAARVRAEQALAERPDDPQANLAAGKFYFFVKDDTDTALAMLAKGDDRELADLAVAEQTPPTDPAGMIDLAKRWSSTSQQAGWPDRQWFRHRAATWYGKARAKSS